MRSRVELCRLRSRRSADVPAPASSVPASRSWVHLVAEYLSGIASARGGPASAGAPARWPGSSGPVARSGVLALAPSTPRLEPARVGAVRVGKDVVHHPGELGQRPPQLLLLPLLVHPGAVLEVEPRQDLVDGGED